MKRTVVWLAAAGVLALALQGASCQRDETAEATKSAEAAGSDAAGDAEGLSGPIYQTYGAHNHPDESGANPCPTPDCVQPRSPGDPADPMWPIYWQSGWTMYRVIGTASPQHVPWNPPPYRDERAIGGRFQKSAGASYYDSTWRGPTGEGMMVESYTDFCLPIFPIPNNFSCKFISLGDVAFFVAGEGPDKPSWMKDNPICLFSPKNHPPRRDFVKHLPYSREDSRRIGPDARAYSFWVCGNPAPNGTCSVGGKTYKGGEIMQAGSYPDQTAAFGILFGYAFKPDESGAMVPQSFYFSGFPAPPASAPMVSQNYVGFRATKPDPSVYAEVANLDPATLPACQLFDPPPTAGGLAATAGARQHPTWADLGRGGSEAKK